MLILDISNLLMNNMPSGVSEEVESEANSYFQLVFNMTSPDSELIDGLLEKLKRFKESSIKHERVIICDYIIFYYKIELKIIKNYRKYIFTCLETCLMNANFIHFILKKNL